jgi:hypothetical protein
LKPPGFCLRTNQKKREKKKHATSSRPGARSGRELDLSIKKNAKPLKMLKLWGKKNLARRPQKAHGRDMTRCASLSRRFQSIRFSDAMRLYPRTYAARQGKKKKRAIELKESMCARK